MQEQCLLSTTTISNAADRSSLRFQHNFGTAAGHSRSIASEAYYDPSYPIGDRSLLLRMLLLLLLLLCTRGTLYDTTAQTRQPNCHHWAIGGFILLLLSKLPVGASAEGEPPQLSSTHHTPAAAGQGRQRNGQQAPATPGKIASMCMPCTRWMWVWVL